MNQLTRPFLLACCAALLFGCAQATPYQAQSASAAVHGGYSQEEIGPQMFRVRFHGNSLTSRETVEAYLLYRAAELTIEQGGDWFAILDRETEHTVTREIRRDPLYRPWYGSYYGDWLPYWSYRVRGRGWLFWDPWHADPFWADRLDRRTIEEFEASADIRIARGSVPSGEPRAYDARRVLADLAPRIVRPKS
jgi:hypothetical protein